MYLSNWGLIHYECKQLTLHRCSFFLGGGRETLLNSSLIKIILNLKKEKNLFFFRLWIHYFSMQAINDIFIISIMQLHPHTDPEHTCMHKQQISKTKILHPIKSTIHLIFSYLNFSEYLIIFQGFEYILFFLLKF